MNRTSAGWILMVLVGASKVADGILLTLVPRIHIARSGRTIEEIQAFDPTVAGWAMHASLEETFSLILIGFAIAVIAFTAYRRHERWSWYALAVLAPGYLIASILIHALCLPTDVVAGDMFFWAMFLGLAIALVALMLPYGAIFGGPSVGTGQRPDSNVRSSLGA